jgi:hypothetical protein
MGALRRCVKIACFRFSLGVGIGKDVQKNPQPIGDIRVTGDGTRQKWT